VILAVPSKLSKAHTNSQIRNKNSSTSPRVLLTSSGVLQVIPLPHTMKENITSTSSYTSSPTSAARNRTIFDH
jgi:hypothetical protein